MTILPIITFQNPLLKKKSLPIEDFNNDTRLLMDNMLHTMYNEKGIGLAAVQIGILKRIIVIDTNYYDSKYNDDECNDSKCTDNHSEHLVNQKPIFLVNPEIIKYSKENNIFCEGCLSFPEIRADITRPTKVTVKYLDYDGKEQILEADDLLATCIQHEIDHLNGITFINHLSKLKQEIILKKLKKNNH